MKNLSILMLSLLFFNSINAQLLKGTTDFDDLVLMKQNQSDNKDATNWLYLNKVTGNLTIEIGASVSPYQVYFILPIAYRNQAPIWIDIQCPEMINYRFVHLDSANVFVVAQLNQHYQTIHLDWTSWVLVKGYDYSNIPESVPIPTLSELPNSVKPWLMPTGCVQWTDPFVQNIADSIRSTTDDLIVLADNINTYCKYIPWTFPISPISFDAYYAMKWGNSCTGHAHAAAALFRANGIPCRVLLNVPTWSNALDMHWSIEYYIPQYGWVIMEPSLGKNPYNAARQEVITFACNPEDEFSMTYPDNIESYWFTSDTAHQHFSPDWGKAHLARLTNATLDTIAKVDSIVSLTDSVYRFFTTYQGICLSDNQNDNFQAAKGFQLMALNHLLSDKQDSLIYYLHQSLYHYNNIESSQIETIFFDNFENGVNGWSHGGTGDEWEIGSPSFPGPSDAYSGTNCWATDIDSEYNNNTDIWLLSPTINLSNLSSAYLSLKIWNDVEDNSQGHSPKDKLWIELSIDNGITFFPITTHLGGVIDYNTGVPQIGGWSRLVLDLTPFIDSSIKIKIRFTSNSSNTRAGSYIDDIHISGIEINVDDVIENEQRPMSIICFPNPSSGSINVEILNSSEKANITVFNATGNELFRKQVYDNKTDIDISNLARGIYFLRVTNNSGFIVEKIIKE